MKIVSPFKQLGCSLWSEHTENCFDINIKFVRKFSAFGVVTCWLLFKGDQTEIFLLVLFHVDKASYLGSKIANKKLLEFLAIADKNEFKTLNTMRKYFGKVFTLRYKNPEWRNVGASCRLNESVSASLRILYFWRQSVPQANVKSISSILIEPKLIF